MLRRGSSFVVVCFIVFGSSFFQLPSILVAGVSNTLPVVGQPVSFGGLPPVFEQTFSDTVDFEASSDIGRPEFKIGVAKKSLPSAGYQDTSEEYEDHIGYELIDLRLSSSPFFDNTINNGVNNGSIFQGTNSGTAYDFKLAVYSGNGPPGDQPTKLMTSSSEDILAYYISKAAHSDSYTITNANTAISDHGFSGVSGPITTATSTKSKFITAYAIPSMHRGPMGPGDQVHSYLYIRYASISGYDDEIDIQYNNIGADSGVNATRTNLNGLKNFIIGSSLSNWIAADGLRASSGNTQGEVPIKLYLFIDYPPPPIDAEIVGLSNKYGLKIMGLNCPDRIETYVGVSNAGADQMDATSKWEVPMFPPEYNPGDHYKTTNRASWSTNIFPNRIFSYTGTFSPSLMTHPSASLYDEFYVIYKFVYVKTDADIYRYKIVHLFSPSPSVGRIKKLDHTEGSVQFLFHENQNESVSNYDTTFASMYQFTDEEL